MWRTEILPLLEELHYGETVEIAGRYGLAALRASFTGSGAEAGDDGDGDGDEVREAR